MSVQWRKYVRAYLRKSVLYPPYPQFYEANRKRIDNLRFRTLKNEVNKAETWRGTTEKQKSIRNSQTSINSLKVFETLSHRRTSFDLIFKRARYEKINILSMPGEFSRKKVEVCCVYALPSFDTVPVGNYLQRYGISTS